MATTRSVLFSTTVLAGFAALTVAVAPAAAQQPPQSTQTAPQAAGPVTAQPNPADQAAGAQEDIAQTDDVVSDGSTEVDAVIVTGSRIRRSPVNAPAPLIQLGREEILQSGEPNVVDFLADIPALQTSTVPEDTTGANLNDGGLSFLDLRNLGTQRTLVLVDGRRHVGSAIGALQVDVDTIPSLLVQNVEIVTGGQSALYGTDAVAGVVNFIMRRNFDGIEIDLAAAEINDDHQMNYRASGLIGRNFLDDRLNVYAFGEYQQSEEVQDLDMDWRREAFTLLNNDSDPALNRADGQFDNILISGARDAFFARGGIFVLANQVIPSSPARGNSFIPGTTLIDDPDFVVTACPAPPALAVRGVSVFPVAGCGAVARETNSTFVFNADGSIRPFNFGTFQDQNGQSRRVNIGGDGLNTGTEFGQGSRLPESDAYRLQTGVNFRITPDIQFFAEVKFVHEETFDSGQPTFFQTNQISEIAANTQPGLFATSAFNIGLDNAFLSETARNLIRNNTRPVIDNRQTIVVGGLTVANPAFGQTTSVISDPRAFFGFFGPSRTQFNERELERYVIGLRGDRDTLGFINNFSWEIGYTHGEVRNENTELGVDVERLFFASDSIRNASGQIVCRVQDFAARGIAIPDQVSQRGLSLTQRPLNPTALIASTDARVTGCTPLSIFGTDFRADANADNITGGGGRAGLSPAQAAYVLATVNVRERNEQDDFLAFASGELWDFWGAGPIGVAVGYEYRREYFEGVGRDATAGTRFLFLNGSLDNPGAEYDTTEFFGEVRLPILTDRPFAQSLEISGAVRYAENSVEAVGEQNTFSLQGLYRPTQDILFRATYGESTRIPTLSNLFNRGFQTFANGLVDPCDSLALLNTTDPVVRNNRRANCQTLLGAGYNPDTTRILYTSGVSGRGGAGNPNLIPEDSRSITWSVALTPRWIPNFSLVFDYYDITIENAIQTVTAQQNLNNCVSGTTINQAACAVLVRNPAGVPLPATPFALVDFAQSALNFAKSRTRGLDFTARYNFDLDYFDFMPRNSGRIDYALRGNYLIRSEDFLNLLDLSDVSENDSLLGPPSGAGAQPRVRFLQTVTYSPNERLSFTWDWDWQSSQEIFDEDLYNQDPDNRFIDYYTTDPFHQHDFSFRYMIRDDLTLRAGVVNAFDEEPERYLGSATTADNFDLFGRRFYLGLNFRR